jgi:hypothetical protein
MLVVLNCSCCNPCQITAGIHPVFEDFFVVRVCDCVSWSGFVVIKGDFW